MVLSHWFDKHIFFYSSPKEKGRNSLHSHRTGNNTTYGLAQGYASSSSIIIQSEERSRKTLCTSQRTSHWPITVTTLCWQGQTTTRCWHASSFDEHVTWFFYSGDQPVTWGQNVDYTEPLPSWECQEFTLLETNMYYWNGLIFYASKSSLNITTWGLRGGLISPGMGTAGTETQEMWDWGSELGPTDCAQPHTWKLTWSWHPGGAFTGPSRTAGQQLRGAKTTLVPKEEQFCRVVCSLQLSSVDQAKSDFTWDHIPATSSLSFFFSFFFLRHERSSFPNWDWTHAPCTGGVESSPLSCQGSPSFPLFILLSSLL